MNLIGLRYIKQFLGLFLVAESKSNWAMASVVKTEIEGQ